MKTTRTSEERDPRRSERDPAELRIERTRVRDSDRDERNFSVVDREPGRGDDDEMFRPFEL